MKIGGLQKTSLLDYPDHISAIIWTLGCNFQCPFCYNVDIVNQSMPEISEKQVLDFLYSRQKQLEAVVITGGEATIQPDLPQFIKKIKALGYKIKLDTNGTYPQTIKNLLENKLLNYIAMDIKAPSDKYHILAGTQVNITKINESIKIIQKYAPDYEFRTTIIPELLTLYDMKKIAAWLKGSKKFVLQQYKHNVPHLNDQDIPAKPYPINYLKNIHKEISPHFTECLIRGEQ